MREFIKWCFDIDTPDYVSIVAFLLALVLATVYICVMIAFFASGLWIVGLFMMLGAPVWFLIHQYGKRDE